MIAVTIFLVCFVLLGGVVMYLSQTIEHGEARFDSDGKVIDDKTAHADIENTEARPARPLNTDTTKAKTDE